MSPSKWLKTKEPELVASHWQHGYGAFSVNQSDIEKAIAYIRNQDEHMKLLERYQIQYDERHVWD